MGPNWIRKYTQYILGTKLGSLDTFDQPQFCHFMSPLSSIRVLITLFLYYDIIGQCCSVEDDICCLLYLQGKEKMENNVRKAGKEAGIKIKEDVSGERQLEGNRTK